MKKWITSIFIAMAVMMAFTTSSMAEDTITEFRIGILGGENASDRLRSNECVRAQIEALLGVPTKIYAPADYNGVIE
ncbi:MAG: phosphonate ABC transporter substrate-binding protein, partial [Desulfobacteraceae bacterium]|nr:phosphonate ABC transporter substrate-binding protein [Desulfobacteraceae bacterium]